MFRPGEGEGGRLPWDATRWSACVARWSCSASLACMRRESASTHIHTHTHTHTHTKQSCLVGCTDQTLPRYGCAELSRSCCTHTDTHTAVTPRLKLRHPKTSDLGGVRETNIHIHKHTHKHTFHHGRGSLQVCSMAHHLCCLRSKLSGYSSQTRLTHTHTHTHARTYTHQHAEGRAFDLRVLKAAAWRV